ncbi:MAG: hypothetical protein SXA11_05040 [Cyanobacteriota bacterium]|nr:hypothetical protein [Cyanobacteriota bacterium]
MLKKINFTLPNNAILLILLTVAIATFTSIYVASEHTIYWWDFVGYNNAANNLANLFRESPERAIDDFIDSLSLQKNYLVTLPAVLFIYLFGNSRLAYILSLTLIYFLPFSLLLGAIATKLISVNPKQVFWSAVSITLLIPIAWSPTLRGYPDIGAALFLLWAVLIYLQNIRLSHWWRLPAIGILLGTSILFRRPYAYTAIAFLAAISCQALVQFLLTLKRNKPDVKKLLDTGIKIGLIALTCFLIILIFARGFIENSLTEDYKTLYTAWSLSLPDIFWRYLCFYGLGTWLIVALGFTLGTRTGLLVPSTTIFLAFFSLFSSIEWLIMLRYGNIHYSLYFTPFVVLGLTAFFWTICYFPRGKKKAFALSIASLYLFINLILGLTPLGKFNNFSNPFFATNFAPLMRYDIDKVLSLTDFISKLAPNRELVLIAANSNHFNANVIRNANRILNRDEAWRLFALSKPHIDSRDTYPLPELLNAEYVAIARPFQTVLLTDEQVLRPGEQDLIKVIHDAFTENWLIARDFAKLPEEFELDKGIVVSLYRRIKPTSVATAVQTLRKMQQQIGERPGRQLDWMSFQQSPYITLNYDAVLKEGDDIFRLMADGSSPKPSTHFLYLGDLSSKVKVKGKLNILEEKCSGISLRLSLLDKDAFILDRIYANYTDTSSPEINFSLLGLNPAYLLLEAFDGEGDKFSENCSWEIDNLSVS